MGFVICFTTQNQGLKSECPLQNLLTGKETSSRSGLYQVASPACFTSSQSPTPNTEHRAGRATVTQHTGQSSGFTAPFPPGFENLARVFLRREARLGTRAQPNFRLFLILLAKNTVLQKCQVRGRNFLANSFGLLDSIWMRAVSSSDRIFRSRPADPLLFVWSCRRSRTSRT